MTKTTVLAVLFFAMSFGLLQAQTNHGDFMLGAHSSLNLSGSGGELMGLGFSRIKFKSDRDGFNEADPDKAVSLNFTPKVGYFVTDNIALGLDLNFATSKVTYGTSEDENTQKLFTTGPFVRYYIPTPTVLPFVEVGGAFGRISTKFDNSLIGAQITKYNVVALTGGAGVAAPLGENVMLDIMAGYSSITTKEVQDNDDNDRTVTGTISLQLGFTVFLGTN